MLRTSASTTPIKTSQHLGEFNNGTGSETNQRCTSQPTTCPPTTYTSFASHQHPQSHYAAEKPASRASQNPPSTLPYRNKELPMCQYRLRYFNCGCAPHRTYYRTRCKVAKEMGVRQDECPELRHDEGFDVIQGRWCPGCPRRLARSDSR